MARGSFWLAAALLAAAPPVAVAVVVDGPGQCLNRARVAAAIFEVLLARSRERTIDLLVSVLESPRGEIAAVALRLSRSEGSGSWRACGAAVGCGVDAKSLGRRQ